MDINLKSIAHILGGEVKGNSALVPGPGHSAKDRSLSITISDSGDDIIVHSFASDDPIECKKYVREKCGLTLKRNGNGGTNIDLAALMQEAIASQRTEPKGKLVDVFTYYDADGTKLYEVLKYDEPRRYAHRLPNGTFEGSPRRVVYRWPDLLKFPATTTYVTEGEKDANRLWDHGMVATTVASGKWTDECIQALKGRELLILEDNDKAGREKALQAAALLYPVAEYDSKTCTANIKIIHLPGLADKGDVSDWLDAGHTIEELNDICNAAPYWTPDSTISDTNIGTTTTEPEPQKPAPENKPASAPLCFVKIADWLGRDPPARDWAVPDRFPLRNVSLISGEGSIGKSLVLMQLTAAMIFAKGWLDTLPEPGDAIYLNAEDEADELWRRYSDIVRLYDAKIDDLLGHLHLLAYAGQDAVLAHANHSGIVKPTPRLKQLIEAAGDIKPKVIGLDTSADIFAGNENDRAQVRQFIGLLRGLSCATTMGSS